MVSELKTPKEKNPNAPQKSAGLPFCDTNCFLVSLKVFLKQQIVFSFENSLSFLFFFHSQFGLQELGIAILSLSPKWQFKFSNFKQGGIRMQVSGVKKLKYSKKFVWPAFFSCLLFAG